MDDLAKLDPALPDVVAHAPWRAQAAERELAGRALDRSAIAAAAAASVAGARPLRDNAFKVELGKRTLIRALRETAAMEI